MQRTPVASDPNFHIVVLRKWDANQDDVCGPQDQLFSYPRVMFSRKPSENNDLRGNLVVSPVEMAEGKTDMPTDCDSKDLARRLLIMESLAEADANQWSKALES